MTSDEWDRHLFGDEAPARAEDPRGLRWDCEPAGWVLRDKAGGTFARVTPESLRGRSAKTATVEVYTGGRVTFHRTGMTFDRVLRFFETLTDPPPPPPPLEAP